MTEQGEVATPPAPALASVRLLVGGAAGAAVLTLLSVPAGVIVGAVLGSAVMNGCRPSGPLGRPFVVTGLVLLGCAAGARMSSDSVRTLAGAAVPLVTSTLLLLLLDVGLALLLHRRYGIDRVTALYACAPGGLSEVLLAAEAAGARTAIVMTVHVVRVLVVVVVALPLLVLLLAPGSPS
jgi:membrane AbrB-like protein